jgi:hypothetical protein
VWCAGGGPPGCDAVAGPGPPEGEPQLSVM